MPVKQYIDSLLDEIAMINPITTGIIIGKGCGRPSNKPSNRQTSGGSFDIIPNKGTPSNNPLLFYQFTWVARMKYIKSDDW